MSYENISNEIKIEVYTRLKGEILEKLLRAEVDQTVATLKTMADPKDPKLAQAHQALKSMLADGYIVLKVVEKKLEEAKKGK